MLNMAEPRTNCYRRIFVLNSSLEPPLHHIKSYPKVPPPPPKGLNLYKFKMATMSEFNVQQTFLCVAGVEWCRHCARGTIQGRLVFTSFLCWILTQLIWAAFILHSTSLLLKASIKAQFQWSHSTSLSGGNLEQTFWMKMQPAFSSQSYWYLGVFTPQWVTLDVSVT